MNKTFSLNGTQLKHLKSPIIFGWKKNNVYVYIGKSLNGIHPIYHHAIIGNWESFEDSDEIDIWLVDKDIMDSTMEELIKLHTPRYNFPFRVFLQGTNLWK